MEKYSYGRGSTVVLLNYIKLVIINGLKAVAFEKLDSCNKRRGSTLDQLILRTFPLRSESGI